MRAWKLLLALAILLGLGLYVWLVEIRGAREREDRRREEERVLGVSPDEVQAIRFRSPRGDFRLVRAEGPRNWTIQEPFVAPAERGAVDAILFAAEAARVERDLGGKALAPSAYGLDPPSFRITLVPKQGQEKTLELGDPAPATESVYARRPGGPVLLVPGNLRAALDVEPLDLRDRRALALEPESIVGIRIERPKEPNPVIALSKDDGGDWRITEPIQVDADDTELEEIRDAIERWKADLVPSESSADATAWGLDAPRVRLTVSLQDKTTRTLAIGGTVPTERIPEGLRTKTVAGPSGPLPGLPAWKLYACREVAGAPEGPVFLMDGDLVKRLLWPVFKFRELRAVRINRWRTDRIRIEGSGVRLEIAQDDDRKWSVRAPGILALEYARVSPLLDAIFELKLRTFLDQLPPGSGPGDLGEPRFSVTVEDGEEKQSQLFTIRGTTPDGALAFYESGTTRGLVPEAEALAILDAARSLAEEAAKAAPASTGP